MKYAFLKHRTVRNRSYQNSPINSRDLLIDRYHAGSGIHIILGVNEQVVIKIIIINNMLFPEHIPPLCCSSEKKFVLKSKFDWQFKKSKVVTSHHFWPRVDLRIMKSLKVILVTQKLQNSRTAASSPAARGTDGHTLNLSPL